MISLCFSLNEWELVEEQSRSLLQFSDMSFDQSVFVFFIFCSDVIEVNRYPRWLLANETEFFERLFSLLRAPAADSQGAKNTGSSGSEVTKTSSEHFHSSSHSGSVSMRVWILLGKLPANQAKTEYVTAYIMSPLCFKGT